MTNGTTRQLAIHEFMLQHQREHGAPPTVREIAKHFDFSSTNAATSHLLLLEKKGLVRHRAGFSRGWIALEVRS